MTSDSENRVNTAMIDGALAAPRGILHFPPPLEQRFEADTGARRCHVLIVRGLIALVLFNFFLVADAVVIPDVFWLAAFARLCIITPVALGLVLVMRFYPPPALREGIEATITVLVAVTSVSLMLASSSPLRNEYHHGIVLLILFVTMVQRIRFAWAVGTCLTCLAVYSIGLSLLPDYPPALKLGSNMIFAAAVLLALIASYALEKEERRNYLHVLRGRLRAGELETLSRQDPLTGLGNRRMLDDTLERLSRRRPGEALAVAMLDIDYFKAFNDTLGHQAGDICIKRVAGLIGAELRLGTDTAYRFGGEEFVVVLPGVDLSGAVAIAERMRRSIADAGIPHRAFSSSGVVTASFGVAATLIGSDVGSAELLAGADAALYAAKRSGRNQVWPRLLSAQPSEIELPTRTQRAGL